MNDDLYLKKIDLINTLKEENAIRNLKVEKAFFEIPREMFVRDEDISLAYINAPLSIGYGQTISQPYMVAYMTTLLNLNENDTVLEVGTGSGYQAAILSKLVMEVYTVERISELAERAKKIFQNLGIKNIKVKVGDGTLGWAKFAPFDKIIVTAAGPKIPESLLKQLKPGGIMIIPVGESTFIQTLKIVKKDEKGKIYIEDDIKCVFVKLLGKEGW